MKKILMIGPFPGVIHGQSIANETLYNGLKEKYIVNRINTAKEQKFVDKSQQGKFIFGKFFKIFLELFNEIKEILIKKYDVVYMTSGQSFLGFMRFSPYMLACMIKKIPYYNHIHGGNFRKIYNSQGKFKQFILRFFIKRSKGIIVLGNSLRVMFKDLIEEEKIYVCENGVQDEFIATEEEIEEKIKRYEKDTKKRVLYLSNLMVEKGILDLLKASEEFSDEEIEFNLAGAIEPSIEGIIKEYLEKYPNKIKYHGIVKEKKKKKLLLENYIFILPSYDEGQPISILEAYANGCAVITDENVGGIKDIFANNLNGKSISHGDIEDIYNKLYQINYYIYIYINYKKIVNKCNNNFFKKKIEEIIC